MDAVSTTAGEPTAIGGLRDGDRDRRRLRLQPQGAPDRAPARPISRSSCATAAARSRRACSATPTSSPAASSAATSCAVRGRVERFRDELQVDLRRHPRAPIRATPTRPTSCRARTATSRSSTASSSTSRARCTTRTTARCSDAFFDDAAFRAELRRAPCTRGGHHAYLGGLLEHTVAVATLALRDVRAARAAQLGPADRAPRCCTTSARRASSSYGADIALCDEGRLLGHLAIGQRMIAERAARLAASRRRSCSRCSHCVLGHHGPDGLPGRRFASPEALALLPAECARRGGQGRARAGTGLNVKLSRRMS